MLQLHTRNLGDIVVAEDRIYNFPFGLPGFPNLQSYALIADPVDELGIFFWLQSLDDVDVSFCLVDLSKLMPEYKPRVGGDFAVGDCLVYNIAVIPEDPRDMTVNLRAPVIINLQAKQGMQFVCHNEDYAIRHRLFEQPKIQ